ncbi:transmembrane channel-like protein 3 [Elysia marginata]|uniref:Transmembrane channel-like protein 3 n=1 Tax=Elysia marginata TaxID=1093978 RepID=A0AAV4JD75_9GAST|nr:transmembrane channel-like protein 3 [Elysia marginata]
MIAVLTVGVVMVAMVVIVTVVVMMSEIVVIVVVEAVVKEVFKLTVTDLVFVVGQILLIDVFRTYFIKYANSLCCWDMEKTFPEYPDFKTAENLLHLISNQGTIWLGSFFAPGLPLLNLLKLIMLVYVRCWVVLTYNAPQQTIFRASRSNNFYFSLLLIMLFLCMLPPLFAIVAVEPSPYCGPFSGSDRIYHVMTRTMTQELPESVSSIIQYAASPGVILPIFMLLGMTIYYLLSVGQSLRDVNNDLKLQLEYVTKHEAAQNAKGKGWVAAKSRLLPAKKEAGRKKDLASTVLEALRASKAHPDTGKRHPPSLAPKPSREGGRGGGGGGGREGTSNRTMALLQKLQEAQRVQTAVPVAVIEGKQSIKASKDRGFSDAKSLLRRRLLEHAKRQKNIPSEDEDGTRTNKYRETPQKIVSRAHARSADRNPAGRNKRAGGYSNRRSPRKSSGVKGNNSDLESDPADDVDGFSKRSHQQHGRQASARDRHENTNFKSRERTTRADVHNVSSTRRPRKEKSLHREGVSNLDLKRAPNGVTRTRSTSPRPTNAKPKKPLLRRVSSSSMIDENGHLKPCDDDDDDEDDEDEDNGDDIDVKEDDSIGDSEDVERDGSATHSDDHMSVNGDLSEGHESGLSSDEDGDVRVHDDTISEESDTNEPQQHISRRRSPSSNIKSTSNKTSNKHQHISALMRKDSSLKSVSYNTGRPTERSKPSAELEVVDESATEKPRKTGKFRSHQTSHQKQTSHLNTPLPDEDGAQISTDKPRIRLKTHNRGPETAIARNSDKDEKGKTKNKEKGNKGHEKLQRTSSQGSSNGQVPTITVEDFSGSSTPTTSKIGKSPHTLGDRKTKNEIENENLSKGKEDEGKKTKRHGGNEKEDASAKDKENKPSWLSMKLRPVNRDKKDKNASQSKNDLSMDKNVGDGNDSQAASSSKSDLKANSNKAESKDVPIINREKSGIDVFKPKVGTSQNIDVFKTDETGLDTTTAKPLAPTVESDVKGGRKDSKTSTQEDKVSNENLTTPTALKKDENNESRLRGIGKSATEKSQNETRDADRKSNSKTKVKVKSTVKNSSAPENSSGVLNVNQQESSSTSQSNPKISHVSNEELNYAGSLHQEETKPKSEKPKPSPSSDHSNPIINGEPPNNANSNVAGSVRDTSQVFTFDEPVYLSATSGNTSPDIPANFGRFRSDRPSLANIYSDADQISQYGGGGGTDVTAADQSESGKEDSAEESRKSSRSRTRQGHLRGNVDNNIRRLSSSTPVHHKETSSLPNGQRFTVLAITNGDLHLEATDDDE